MDNMGYWDQGKDVPESFLKKITGGRLKGKSDISPQWRLMRMTEIFGPVGFGWYYETVKRWTEEHNGEVSAHVVIKLYYKMGEEWSKGVEGQGGSMLLEKERNGLHHSDEAYKMATTDALSVAMKEIGIAANVYLGKMDGSKWQEKEKQYNPPVDTKATEFQIDKLMGMAVEMETSNPKGADFLDKKIKSGTLTKAEAQKLIDRGKK